MLAERGEVADLGPLAAAGYVFDLKVDGVRSLVSVGASGAHRSVMMTSRLGSDLCGRFPELVDALRQQLDAAPDGVILDAEIAVPDPRGLPSWPLTQRRSSQRRGTDHLVRTLPARLYVFDLLRLGDQATTGWPLHRRRAALTQLARGWTPPLEVTLSSDNPEALWRVVEAHMLEGVVAKRRDSPYRPGRSRDWVKIKVTRTVSCLVGGVDWGAGQDGPTDPRQQPRALELYLVTPDGDLVEMGRVAGAASGALRAGIRRGLARPPLIVEVEYSQLTAAGRLRQPVLRRVRTDIDVLDCGTDQLPGLLPLQSGTPPHPPRAS